MNGPERPAKGLFRFPGLRRPLLAALLAALLTSAALLAPLFAVPAQAEPIHVSASADAGTAPPQARQQAQERAFTEAVFQTAQRLLPAPLPDSRPGSRAELLRRFLAPRAVDFVQSFQEAPAKTAASGTAAPGPASQAPATTPAQAAPAQSAPPQAAPAQAAPLTLEMDVEVNRAGLSDLLTRLGLLAGARHPRSFSLRLGSGLTEPELSPLEELLALQGLKRTMTAAGQAPVSVSLERVAQGGYLKAVLRPEARSQDAKSQEAKAPEARIFVADGRDLAQLWLEVWGQYFSAREQLAGGAASPIEVAGFALVDGVLDFTRTLSSWDDCLREVMLHNLDLRPGNSSARWSARVTNPERLNERLQEYLPSRQLKTLR